MDIVVETYITIRQQNDRQRAVSSGQLSAYDKVVHQDINASREHHHQAGVARTTGRRQEVRKNNVRRRCRLVFL